MNNNNVSVNGISNVDISGSNLGDSSKHEDDRLAAAAGLLILADVSSKAKKIPTQPKRPPNAYILFSKANREFVQRKYPDLSFQHLSKRMGEQWRALSHHEKQPYIIKARREAEAHKIKYPGYVYCPAKARQCKRERERRRLIRRKCRNLQAVNAPQCSSTDVQGLVHFNSDNTTDKPQAVGEMFGAAEMINMECAANNEIHLALNVPNNDPTSENGHLFVPGTSNVSNSANLEEHLLRSEERMSATAEVIVRDTMPGSPSNKHDTATIYPLEPETIRGSREAESVQANVPFEAGNISMQFYHNGCFCQYPAGPGLVSNPYPFIVHYTINHQSYGVPVVDSQVPLSPSRSAWSSASLPATYVIGTHVTSHPSLLPYHHVPNHATSPCVPPPFHAHRYENSPYVPPEVLASLHPQNPEATIHRRSDSAMFDEASSVEGMY